MKKVKLTSDEAELVDMVEAGQFASALDEERRKELAAIAGDTFKKDKRINIRISSRDLMAVQSRAVKEGIPYQTLIASIVHKYVSGSLLDVAASIRWTLFLA